MKEELIYGKDVVISGGFFVGQVGRLLNKMNRALPAAKPAGGNVPQAPKVKTIYVVQLMDGMRVEVDAGNVERLDIKIKDAPDAQRPPVKH